MLLRIFYHLSLVKSDGVKQWALALSNYLAFKQIIILFSAANTVSVIDQLLQVPFLGLFRGN